jgi:predicted SnoaL-like aldol condensation-catalyzing enzyme
METGYFKTFGEMAAMSQRKQDVVSLLKTIEKGGDGALQFINPDKYIQHNLAIGDGVPGLAAALAQLPPGSARVNTVRVFEDGDFVFAHTDYDFFGPKIGFDIFRYEEGRIVEHWDNLQVTPKEPNPAGHTMLDGPVEAADLDRTEENKALIRRQIEDIIAGKLERLPLYFDGNNYIQHNPLLMDGLSGLGAGLKALAEKGVRVKYDRVHKVLGEGSFVLAVSEGIFGSGPAAYYDLYRIENGKIAEHWDVVEAIPPKEEHKNGNGKF